VAEDDGRPGVAPRLRQPVVDDQRAARRHARDRHIAACSAPSPAFEEKPVLAARGPAAVAVGEKLRRSVEVLGGQLDAARQCGIGKRREVDIGERIMRGPVR
jgi:hypothetical protein